MHKTKFQFESFEQENQRLASLRKYAAAVPDADPDLHKLVKIAAYICQVPISLVNLVEANHTIFKAAIGTDLRGSAREISFCAQAIKSTGVFEVPDASRDARFKDNPLVTGATQIRFYAGSPLVNKDGMRMGTLCVFDQQPKILAEEQKETLETLSQMAVMVMEHRTQTAVLQKANLAAVIALENKVNKLSEQLESVRKFLPAAVAAELMPQNQPTASFTLLKDTVVLHCRLHGPAPAAFTDITFLPKIYSLMANVVSTFNGIVHHIDGNDLSALFSEPLATIPYEENALYCAFELTEQFDKQLQLEKPGDGLYLTTCMHSGPVQSGFISLPNRVEYTLSGKMVEESKLIRNEVKTKNSAVVISGPFFEKVRRMVEIVARYKVNNPAIPLHAFEVTLARP